MRTLICLLAAAACAYAADVTGKWTGSVEIKNPEGEIQTHAISFQFRQSGQELTGALSADGKEIQITNGKVEGDAVSFQVQPGDEAPTFTVKLTLAEDDLKGDASAERDGETRKGKVTLKRSPPSA
jgi:hypothetical protein